MPSAAYGMTTVKERYEALCESIGRAAERSGRSLQDITLVGVTKGVSADKVLEAQACGVRVFGENRVQDAAEKVPAVQAEWHLIGPLQSNKIKTALSLFQCFQSLDRLSLAQKLNDELAAENRVLPVLIEINVSGEDQKHGFSPEDAYSAADAIRPLAQLDVRGVMGIAPNTADMGARRAAFRKLRGIYTVFKGMKGERFQMKHLSMGMSDDFEIAVEEGSNMLRIGRALFGNRKKK